MKKHYYYLLVNNERVAAYIIVKAFSKKQVKEHAMNFKNVVARYNHYADAKAAAEEIAGIDAATGQPFIDYTSLTGVDYVD